MKSICILLLVLTVSVLFADIPKVISYQGRLADSLTGEPIPNGLYNIVFKLFDVPGPATELWVENHPNTPVVGGLYSAILGMTTPFPDTVDFSEPYWLEVIVGGTPFTPRYRLTSSPYALNIADTIQKTSTQIFDCNVYITDTLGIGTSSPGRLLDVSGLTPSSQAVARFVNHDDDGLSSSGISAECSDADGYGIGGSFEGGRIGVRGDVSPSGSGNYYGFFGYVSGGSGNNTGALGRGTASSGNCVGIRADATGSGTNYGIHASASGGTTDLAGYFEGNVDVSGDFKSTGTTKISLNGCDFVGSGSGASDIEMLYQNDASVEAYESSADGQGCIMAPIPIPTYLYGNSVEIDSMRIYYKTYEADDYITYTCLRENTLDDNYGELSESNSDYNSTTLTSYKLTCNDVVDASTGPLYLFFTLTYDADGGTITIYGVEIYYHQP